MRPRLLIVLTFLLATPSCGGDTPTASYATPAEAAEAGARAMAAGNTAEAAAAFEAAAASPDPAAKRAALTNLFRAQLEAGSNPGALGALERLATESREGLTAEALNDLATAALNRKNADVADAVINKALTLFPEQKAVFANAVAAVDMLKTQGPGADLSSLGYTGD